MRLLNTSNLDLEQFEGVHKQKYAILSHRWKPGEVLFADVVNGPSEQVKQKPGWEKIIRCCEQARRDGYDYVWIDTCCIDKSSSAELTEAINSMFKWYEESHVCFAYLEDVEVETTLEVRDDSPHVYDKLFLTQFYASEWFTRGWTLQELLAPGSSMKFFNRNWTCLGSKAELCSALTCATFIPSECLLRERQLFSYTIAQRMSWASRRETTRVEDLAYSLLGIFGVNMPLIYGERGDAFLRLQEEILRRSDDESILLWEGDKLGLLAQSPAAFRDHLPKIPETIKLSARPSQPVHVDLELRCRFRKERQPCTLTNIGLSITLRLMPWFMDIFCVKLQVEKTLHLHGQTTSFDAYIFLHQTVNDSRLARVKVLGESIHYVSTKEGPALDRLCKKLGLEFKPCVIAHDGWDTSAGEGYLRSWDVSNQRYGFKFNFQPHECWGKNMTIDSTNILCRRSWCSKAKVFVMDPGYPEAVAIFRLSRATRRQYMYFGFTPNFTPVMIQKDWHMKSPFKSSDDLCHTSENEKRKYLKEALAYDHFWHSITEPNSERELIIQGSQNPHKVTLVGTDIEDLSIMITRWVTGYNIDFMRIGTGHHLESLSQSIVAEAPQSVPHVMTVPQKVSAPNVSSMTSYEPSRPTNHTIRSASAILSRIDKIERSLGAYRRSRPTARPALNGEVQATLKVENATTIGGHAVTESRITDDMSNGVHNDNTCTVNHSATVVLETQSTTSIGSHDT